MELRELRCFRLVLYSIDATLRAFRRSWASLEWIPTSIDVQILAADEAIDHGRAAFNIDVF